MQSQNHASPIDPCAQFILVVDDSALIRKMMKSFIQAKGFVVLTASNGLEAVELAPMFPFAAIITDIDMPGMDGLEALRRIRAMGGNCSEIPAAVVSGHCPGPDRKTCGDLGIHLFSLKGEGLGPLAGFLGRLPTPSSRELAPCE
ncbi:Putative chemotaxis response regulator protein-glutamate methylesterase [Magnetospirillum gryphiswaldense MSR-1 v2]|uniref:Chemotaxis response regulator protein-glutamate methylesterase n=1 Tax=Magnetospirillum gryphiswaldense (strain DSM 6361 / JCM 21280 / NBRC 15271 / MSR-1) TaxID=431944 RepID=V6F704_MAGGM|nr:response regulator [Magnetospirillum gryphiswaldense]CDL01239.1 Putative chemotaxis response regulator protein-glutamate methylesterase [Magnetospirillum gryphiswaldense MSR-1 v2]